MPARKGFVEFRLADVGVPLNAGESVPCPNCDARHVVKTDPRPGASLDVATGTFTKVPNVALYIDCPKTAGPILVGMDGRALPVPLELTPRKGGH